MATIRHAGSGFAWNKSRGKRKVRAKRASTSHTPHSTRSPQQIADYKRQVEELVGSAGDDGAASGGSGAAAVAAGSRDPFGFGALFGDEFAELESDEPLEVAFLQAHGALWRCVPVTNKGLICRSKACSPSSTSRRTEPLLLLLWCVGSPKKPMCNHNQSATWLCDGQAADQTRVFHQAYVFKHAVL